MPSSCRRCDLELPPCQLPPHLRERFQSGLRVSQEALFASFHHSLPRETRCLTRAGYFTEATFKGADATDFADADWRKDSLLHDLSRGAFAYGKCQRDSGPD